MAVHSAADGGAQVLVHVPVVEANTAALIVSADHDADSVDGDEGGELDLATHVTRLIARRLGMSIALARQAGQDGANVVITLPASAPA